MIHTGTVEKFNASIEPSTVEESFAKKNQLFGVDNGNGRYVKVFAVSRTDAEKIAKLFLKAIGEQTDIHQIDILGDGQQVVGIKSY